MINVSETAASKITELLSEENKDGSGLRVFVQGGGCSGIPVWPDDRRERPRAAGDQVYESHGIKLFVDPISVRYLTGAQVDFVDTRHRRWLHHQESERDLDLRLRVIVHGGIDALDVSGLRPVGGKRSSKRDRILNIFLRQKGHLSADELCDLVRREDAGIGRANVYRTLQWMVNAGNRPQGRFR